MRAQVVFLLLALVAALAFFKDADARPTFENVIEVEKREVARKIGPPGYRSRRNLNDEKSNMEGMDLPPSIS